MLGKTFLHLLVLMALVSLMATWSPRLTISCSRSTTSWNLLAGAARTAEAALTTAVWPTPFAASSTALWLSSSSSAASAILAAATNWAPLRVGAMLRKLETLPVSAIQFWAAWALDSVTGAAAAGAARASDWK